MAQIPVAELSHFLSPIIIKAQTFNSNALSPKMVSPINEQNIQQAKTPELKKRPLKKLSKIMKNQDTNTVAQMGEIHSNCSQILSTRDRNFSAADLSLEQ